MSRRRVLEFVVAALVFLLLLSVLFVRSTWHGTLPPPITLFHESPGAPPDFSSGAYRALRARAPDGAREAALYPAEFEVPSALYVLAPGRAPRRFLLADSLSTTLNPKWVGWLDADLLGLTLGELYGTVSPGGDLFLVDPETGRAAVLWASPDSGQTQALSARPEGQGEVRVRLAVFGPAMSGPRDSTLVLPSQAVARARQILRPAG